MPSTAPPPGPSEQPAQQRDNAERLAYEPPRLSALGDLRQLTLGGSLGRGDSGNARLQARR
jgi:hypothetical protein